jgi:hypothetical protein
VARGGKQARSARDPAALIASAVGVLVDGSWWVAA